jgi:hypothetical protein
MESWTTAYGCRALQWHPTGNRHDWSFVSGAGRDDRSFDEIAHNGADLTLPGEIERRKVIRPTVISAYVESM